MAVKEKGKSMLFPFSEPVFVFLVVVLFLVICYRKQPVQHVGGLIAADRIPSYRGFALSRYIAIPNRISNFYAKIINQEKSIIYCYY